MNSNSIIIPFTILMAMWSFSTQVISNAVNSVDENLKIMSEANIKFSIDFYKSIIEDDKTVNVMFSPFSIASALALTRTGAKGNSAKEIETVLNLQDIETSQINSAFAEMNARLFQTDVADNITLLGANAAFHDRAFTLTEDFRTALTYYDSKFIPVNFKETVQSVKTVNDFISSATEGKITDMLSDDAVTSDSKMVLVNTLYFKGNWENAFNKMQMDERDFFVSHYRIIRAPFMYQRGKFNFAYVEELTLQIVELPYQGNISMVILLPDNFDLDSVEKNLNYMNLTNWLDSTRKQTVDLTIPKFNLSESLDAKKHLINLGVKEIFDESKADLSGISGAKNLVINDVQHKGILEVTEEGSVAAAATTISMVARSINIPVLFLADHPFVWLILHKPTNQILFLGRLKRPEGKETNHDEL